MVIMEKLIERMKAIGMAVPPIEKRLKINDAEQVLDKCYSAMLQSQGKIYQKQPEYAFIAEWLSDNKGKGLFLYGNCGRGKSFLARYVIPAIFLVKHEVVFQTYNATDLSQDVDRIKELKYLVIDDLGTEFTAVNYGQRRNVIDEIIDKAEQNANILIITTNLTKNELETRYGERVMNRLNSLTKRVCFEGESLR